MCALIGQGMLCDWLKNTHTHLFNGPLSGTTWVSQYQKGKTNLDFAGARDSEWQWNPLGHMQVCTSHQTDNHASTPPLSFLQAGCPSCHATNSVKALKARSTEKVRKKWGNLVFGRIVLTVLTVVMCEQRTLAIFMCCGCIRADVAFTAGSVMKELASCHRMLGRPSQSTSPLLRCR